jgi:L-amino acid N-acyltransferase YncA
MRTDLPRHARRADKRPGAAPLSVRLAVPADAAAIARIYNQSLPPQPAALPAQPGPAARRDDGSVLPRQGMAPLSERQILWWLEQHRLSGRPLWVAQVRNAVVGWLSLLGFHDRPGCGSAAEAAIYIGTGWQGRGIGRCLVQRALREAPQWGLDRLMAFIWHDNEASQGLFRSLGFMAWGSLPGVVRVGGQGRNMLIFGYQLDPVAAAVRSA